MGIKVGSGDIVKMYVGTSEVDKIYVGTTLVYSRMPQLVAPAMSYTNPYLFLTDMDGNTQYFDVYEGETLITSIAKQ